MADKNKHRNTDVTAVKIAFVRWLLDPRRQPKTQEQWARDHEIAPETLSHWKTEDEFVLSLLKKAETLLEPFWAEAVANIVRIATQQTDDYAAVQAFGQLSKILGKDKIKVDITGRMGLLEWLGSDIRQPELHERPLN
jgi:hypothetical protein